MKSPRPRRPYRGGAENRRQEIKEVKFWVDNRDNLRGSMKKMPPEVYTPLIEEAHKHGMVVHAHATNLGDQKGVVKAGVDVLVHTLVAEKVDDEFVEILKAKRPYWAPVMGLGDRSELCDGDNRVHRTGVAGRV